MKPVEQYEELNLRCLNPRGMINSYWALPLIFRFVPTNTESIQVTKRLIKSRKFQFHLDSHSSLF